MKPCAAQGVDVPRPIEALIHPDALAHNLTVVRQHTPHARVWAVLKANAYGHGLAWAYEALRGADGFAVLEVDEAISLRQMGWRGPVLLLEGCFEARDLEACSSWSLWHVVHCEEQIDWLSRHKTEHPHHVHLKINTGMNRLGFASAQARSAWARLQALPQVEDITLMSHFATADDGRGVADQMRLFESVTRDLPGSRCLSNSAAILRHPQLGTDWVRSGIMSYGHSPDYPLHSAAQWGLRPAMTLRTRLIATQALQPGDTVGYGSTFCAPHAMRIGIAACGYADGYPRACATGTPVLVAGQRTRTVGRVSMDMLAVDLSALAPGDSAPGVGSEVTLWGYGPGGAVLAADEVAHAGATIAYELTCAVAARVPKRLASGGPSE